MVLQSRETGGLEGRTDEEETAEALDASDGALGSMTVFMTGRGKFNVVFS